MTAMPPPSSPVSPLPPLSPPSHHCHLTSKPASSALTVKETLPSETAVGEEEEGDADADADPDFVTSCFAGCSQQTELPASSTGAPADVTLESASASPSDLPPAVTGDVKVEIPKEEAEQAGGDDEDEGDPDNYWDKFEMPDGPILDKISWAINLPWLVAFTATIPDCSKTVAKAYYPVTFAMSIVWIGIVCLFMVVCASRIGCIMNVNATVMGICVLAVGTSVPDAMGSMAVAANGEADMAIANAVGSNVFDILLGLGVPWFLNGAIKGSTAVDKCGIEIAVFILFSTIGLFFLTLILNKWQMNNRLGMVFFGLYIVYYIYSLLTGFNVFVPVECDEDDDGAH
mmetsp:Transcript_107088/g.310927  ORF Transcript_107088/g.310927 Transcript_107088/m.310927 type:complete len:344 (-) Transcript_107088:529-1560(-)